MADDRQVALTRRVANRWLLQHEKAPQSREPFHLPVAMVAALEVGDLVEGLDTHLYKVTAVGPGSITLETPTVQLVFTNRGYASYSWAYFLAPLLHWLINR